MNYPCSDFSGIKHPFVTAASLPSTSVFYVLMMKPSFSICQLTQDIKGCQDLMDYNWERHSGIWEMVRDRLQWNKMTLTAAQQNWTQSLGARDPEVWEKCPLSGVPLVIPNHKGFTG